LVAFGGWLIWALPKARGLTNLLSKVFFLLIGFMVLNFVLPTVMQETVVGKRWMELIQSGDGTIGGALENDARLHFFRLGMEIWKENPIAGVGLGHFLLYNPSGQVSHSDYIESLTGTGIVGFVLYQSMKVILLFRLLRLKRIVQHPYERYVIQILLLMWINIVLSGVGFHLYTDYQFVILTTTLITYSWVWEKQIQGLLSHGRPLDPYAVSEQPYLQPSQPAYSR